MFGQLTGGVAQIFPVGTGIAVSGAVPAQDERPAASAGQACLLQVFGRGIGDDLGVNVGCRQALDMPAVVSVIDRGRNDACEVPLFNSPGLPDEDGNYNETPEMMSNTIGRFADSGL